MSGEKTLPPTPKRLKDARKEGQVALTPSVPHLLAAAATFELLAATSDLWLSQAPQLLATFLEHLADTNPAVHLSGWDFILPLVLLAALGFLAPLLVASLMAFVGNVMQTGFIVAPAGVAKLERLNPIAHAKNLLDTEHLVGLLMNVVKLAAVFMCTGLGIALSMDTLLRLGDGTLVQAAQAVIKVFVLCERLSLLPLMVAVLIDWALRRQAHLKSLRMSRQELETEQKDQFGDKHVRAKRKDMSRDLLGGELTESTRKSNAVVTNPTHFAIALFYDAGVYPLPVVMARGADERAALIRRIAREEGIPIIRSAQLARLLYSIGREWRPVPSGALKAVAAVYRVVAQLRSGDLQIDDMPDLSDAELGDEDAGGRGIGLPPSRPGDGLA